MVVGQVIPMNPAHAVRGPKHTQKKGKTPVLTPEEARTKRFLDSRLPDPGVSSPAPNNKNCTVLHSTAKFPVQASPFEPLTTTATSMVAVSH